MGNSARVGFRVLKVQRGSPAERAGLQPFVDFVLEVNGTRIVDSEMSLLDMLKRNVLCVVTLTVWSLVSQENRDVKVELRDDWGGTGVLGARLALQSISEKTLNVLHVTAVTAESPAAEAGLEEQQDYILGTVDQVLSSSDALATMAERLSEMTLIVYSAKLHSTREVVVKPRADWGGSGVMGCQVAEGLLHRPSLD